MWTLIRNCIVYIYIHIYTYYSDVAYVIARDYLRNVLRWRDDEKKKNTRLQRGKKEKKEEEEEEDEDEEVEEE